jgi:hypothetical protein
MSLTRQEVFQALADGKTIELKNPRWAGYRPLDHTNYLPLKSDSFNNFDWRIKPKPPKWYENIPKQGVLCWVSSTVEYPNRANSSLTIIKALDINGNYADYLNHTWFDAEPLTNEEIKQFLRGE